jgi:putative phosphoribosyl transferase
MFTSFPSREEAGKKLGKALAALNYHGNLVVLGLPRGGVPVAAAVADVLHVPLDIIVVRKIGAPNNPELACGAVATGGVVVWNHDLLRRFVLIESDFQAAIERERAEVERREREIRGHHGFQVNLHDRVVILVDDGLATGASMRAAIRAVKMFEPLKVVVAVPVAPKDTCDEIEEHGDRVECLQRIPSGRFSSVGEWYDDFSQVSTAECRQIYADYQKRQPSEGGLHAY